MVLKANINALNFMRAAIGNQCKLINRGVTCVLFGSLKLNLAAAFWISLCNSFFCFVCLFQAHVYLGLAIMCGFVLFDTQLIIEKAEMGDKDYIW